MSQLPIENCFSGWPSFDTPKSGIISGLTSKAYISGIENYPILIGVKPAIVPIGYFFGGSGNKNFINGETVKVSIYKNNTIFTLGYYYVDNNRLNDDRSTDPLSYKCWVKCTGFSSSSTSSSSSSVKIKYPCVKKNIYTNKICYNNTLYYNLTNPYFVGSINSINGNGDELFTAGTQNDLTTGKLFCYKLTNDQNGANYILNQSINLPYKNENKRLNNVKVSKNGNVLAAISPYNFKDGLSDVALCYLYKKLNNTGEWQLFQTVSGFGGYTNTFTDYGEKYFSLDLDYDGKTIAIGNKNLFKQLALDLFTTSSQVTVFTGDASNNLSYKFQSIITGQIQKDFGKEIAINGLGDKIAIYSYGTQLNTKGNIYAGKIDVFKKSSATNWSLFSTINPEINPSYYNAINFGKSLSFDFSGNNLVVGGKVNESGIINVYNLSGNSIIKKYEFKYSGNFNNHVKINYYGDKIFTTTSSLEKCYKNIETLSLISGEWKYDQILTNPYKERKSNNEFIDINNDGNILVLGSNLEDLDIFSTNCISSGEYEPCNQNYLYCVKPSEIERVNTLYYPKTNKIFSKSTQLSEPFGIVLGKNLKKYTSDNQLGPRSLADANTKQLFIVNSNYNNIAIITAFGCNQGYIFDYMPQVDVSGDLSGPINQARFNGPQGIAINKNNIIYLTDTNNHKIKKIEYDESVDDYIVSTFAGGYILSNNGNIKSGDLDGVISASLLNQPYGICVDDYTNDIYFTDYGNHKIKKIQSNGSITTIGGNGSPGYENGIGTGSRFNGPKGITIDSIRKILYVADSNNHVIRTIDLKRNNTDLFAGIPFQTGDSTGDRYLSKFNSPQGVYYSSLNNSLMIADTKNNKVKRILDQTENIVEYVNEINDVKNITFDLGENLIKNKQARLIYFEAYEQGKRKRLGCSIATNDNGDKIVFGAESFNQTGKVIYSGSNKIEIFPTNGYDGKRFGYDVSINKNGNTLGISSLDDISFYNINSSETNYTLIRYYTPPIPGPYSLSISNDGTKALIGAGYSPNQIGKAYLYDINNNNLLYTFVGNNQPGDKFGFDVDISSNDNAIIIGAPKTVNSECELIPNSTIPEQYYSTFINLKNGETGLLSAYYPKSCIGLGDYPNNYVIDRNLSEAGCVDAGLKPDGTTARGQNGIVGRLIAPNYSQFSIGLASFAHRHDGTIYSMSAKNKTQMLTDFNNAYNQYIQDNPFKSDCKPGGAAFIFTKINNDWSNWSGQKILGRNAPNDNFGISVSIDGSGNNIIIGANNENVNGPSVGSAYIFSKNFNNKWDLNSKKFGCEKNNFFGTDVKINFNGNMILISSPFNDFNGINAGLVYGYKSINGFWEQTDLWGGLPPQPKCVLSEGYDYCTLYETPQNYFGEKLAINNLGNIGYAGEPGRSIEIGGVYKMNPLGEGLDLPCASSSSTQSSSTQSSSSQTFSSSVSSSSISSFQSSSSSSEFYESSSSCGLTSITNYAYIGDIISIIGSNFANMKVSFCGCFDSAAEIIYKTNTLLQVKVPECAKSGPVIIDINNGSCSFERYVKIYKINKIYPESGRISIISDASLSTPTFSYNSLPQRVDTLNINLNELSYCKPNENIQINYFGNLLKYNKYKSESNSWSDLNSLFNLIKKISFGSSGALDVSGNISGYLYPGYLLKNCPGCIKKIEINRSDENAATGEIKIYYDNINLFKDPEQKQSNENVLNQTNFIKFEKDFSGRIFSYSKSLTSGNIKNLDILKTEPFYFSNLYLNSKKINPQYENKQILEINSTGKINQEFYNNKLLTGYIVSTSLAGKYKEIFGNKIFNDENIVPYDSYVKEIYQSIYSGYEPYFYEKNKNDLPGSYPLYQNIDGNVKIKYLPKIYKINRKKLKENAILPKEGEKHILLFDINLYGISGATPEECDQEINAYVIDESDFYDVVKNPSMVNLTITDLNNKITGVVYDTSQIIQQKNLLDELSVKTNISTDASFYNANSYVNDFNMLKMDIKIKAPSKTCPQTIGQFYFFEYTGFKDPNTVNSYKLLIRQNNNTIAEGSYITGEKTGYMINLLPGDYTLILSGLEKENGYIYN